MADDRFDGWGLHPELRAKLVELEVRALREDGIAFRVTSGARTFERQALLYAAWRKNPAEARSLYGVVSAPAPMGVSRHHPFFSGMAAAVDLAVVNRDGQEKTAAQEVLGNLAGAIGLRWGGEWGDRVHFELREVGGRPLDVWDLYQSLARRLDALAAGDAT